MKQVIEDVVHKGGEVGRKPDCMYGYWTKDTCRGLAMAYIMLWNRVITTIKCHNIHHMHECQGTVSPTPHQVLLNLWALLSLHLRLWIELVAGDYSEHCMAGDIHIRGVETSRGCWCSPWTPTLCTLNSGLIATAPQLHVANHGYEYERRFGRLLCGTWCVDLGSARPFLLCTHPQQSENKKYM